MSSGVWHKSRSSMSMSLSAESMSLGMDPPPAELHGDPIVMMNTVSPLICANRSLDTLKSLISLPWVYSDSNLLVWSDAPGNRESVVRQVQLFRCGVCAAHILGVGALPRQVQILDPIRA
ncbi:hypothetical protein F443_00499 [Phytophthora nicotianae P1569]|uniref:Uncharacterized protein n=1 Tax=Phytophthora nicotianae P1569 TaxID=1317065 RepID=V9G251_PHYNI|nr:hypothetical protein F443_00499 [Phytophthora nicotianae P1569]